jgi:hypothetical protein
MLIRRSLGIAGAIGLALLGSSAFALTVFGSKLNHEPTPAETCRAAAPFRMCTWVLTIGQQNVGKERAPKNGTINRLVLRSCSAGSFVLQIARGTPATRQFRVMRTGPTINYKGSPSNCSGGLFVEAFTVNVPVLTGEYLAVVATKVGFIYNASGDGSLAYDPPLPDGGPLRVASQNTGSGFLLLQAQMNN